MDKTKPPRMERHWGVGDQRVPAAENPENGRKPGHDQPSEPGQDHDEDIVCDLHSPDDVVFKSAHGHSYAPVLSFTLLPVDNKFRTWYIMTSNQTI